MIVRVRCGMRGQTAFTLLEILLASVAAAMILVIINSIFVRAIHLRDSATERVRDTRLRARAERAIRDDLQSALVSGGILASTLDGGTNNTGGPGGASFPGYLKLTTTNGHSASGLTASDVQQVEYFVQKDPNPAQTLSDGGAPGGGVLVRAVTRDLLANTPVVSKEETILTGVQSLQVQFYDGANWQDTWEFDSDTASESASAASGSTTGATLTTGNTTLPEAIRVDVRQVAAKSGDPAPPPVEILVPWSAQPFVGATPATSTVNPGGTTTTTTTTTASKNGQNPQPLPGNNPPGNLPPGGQRPPPGVKPPSAPTGGRAPSK